MTIEENGTSKGNGKSHAETGASGDLSAQSIIELTAEATLRGRTPLLMHTMSEAAIIAQLIQKQREPPKTDEPLEKKAERGLYLNPNGDGKIGIPTTCLLACLREAGRSVQYEGRTMIMSGTKGNLLPSFLTIDEPFLVIPDANWKVDVKRGCLPGSGTAVGIVRPRFDKWSIKVTMTIRLEAPITEATVKKLFLNAGRRVGLLSFRPACGGIYGQFDVCDWKELSRENVASGILTEDAEIGQA